MVSCRRILALWRGRYLAVGGVRCRSSDFAVVIPLNSTVYQMSRCLRMCTSVGAGGVSIASQQKSWMGRTTGVGLPGRPPVADLVDVLGSRSWARGVLRRLG